MSRRRQRYGLPTEAALAVPAALAVAALLAFGFSALAQPPHVRERLAAIQADTAKAAELEDDNRGVTPYPRGAVCSDPATAQGKVRKALDAAAARAGVTLVQPAVAPTPLGEDGARLPALRLSFQATGSYEAVTQLLGDLAALQPAIFADTVDLKSQVSSVSLRFSGRVFCSTSAHS